LLINRYLAALCTIGLLAGCGPAQNSSSENTLELREELRAQSEAYVGMSVEQLSSDKTAAYLSERLYDANCASCHGINAQGKHGVTDLVAGIFNFGSNEDAIRATIAHGRQGTMPAMGSQFGEMDLGQLVAYVQSLSSDEPMSRSAERGERLFAEDCAVCHGVDGLGIRELGAPNLADDYWLHSDSMMDIRLVITRGVQAECPPYLDTLTGTEIDLLTAYVLALGDGPGRWESK
jgi:cytochrome c oxidase cbb3-type subunit 3